MIEIVATSINKFLKLGSIFFKQKILTTFQNGGLLWGYIYLIIASVLWFFSLLDIYEISNTYFGRNT